MEIFVFGCGGHAKVVSDVIRAAGGWTIAGYIAPEPDDARFLGHEVIEESRFLQDYGGSAVALAVGDNSLRRKLYARTQESFSFPVLVHPSASVSPSSRLGEGTVVMPGAVINAEAQVGRFCVVNSAAVLEHDCRLEDYVSLAPRACVCGSCSLGEGCYIGAGATIIQGRRLGQDCLVAAGAVVCADIDDNSIAMGVPARVAR